MVNWRAQAPAGVSCCLCQDVIVFVESHHSYSPNALHSQVRITIYFDKIVLGFSHFESLLWGWLVLWIFLLFWEFMLCWISKHEFMVDSLMDYEVSNTSLGWEIQCGCLDCCGMCDFGLMNEGFFTFHVDLPLDSCDLGCLIWFWCDLIMLFLLLFWPWFLWSWLLLIWSLLFFLTFLSIICLLVLFFPAYWYSLTMV